MSRKLSDLSLSTLRRMLRATVRAAGEQSVSARLIRRAIAAKNKAQSNARPRNG